MKLSKEKMLEIAERKERCIKCEDLNCVNCDNFVCANKAWGEEIAFYEKVRELMQADAEGRLVVLPCKVGDTALVKDRAGVPLEMRLEAPDIRFVCTDENNLCMATCNRKPNGFCSYRIRNDGSDIGKTVFLTREEAEAALERMRGVEE